jgi:chromosome segregation ATPase
MAASSSSVQQAHDHLVELSSFHQVNHSCPLCSSAGIESAKEENTVTDTDNRYSESQHLALLESALTRETAELTVVKEEAESRAEALTTEKAALEQRLAESEQRVGVLEAEKASAEAAAEAARAEFTEFKAEQERAAEVAARREARSQRVKAANAALDDSHFTEERIGRWAEMSDEAFDAVVAAYEAGASASAKETASDANREQVRQTAAFKDGSDGGTEAHQGSLVGSFLNRRFA